MGKIVNICGTDYEMSASALTPAHFKNIFGMEEDYTETYFRVLKKLKSCDSKQPKKLTDDELNKLSKEEVIERKNQSINAMQDLYSCLDDVLKIAYCLIKENDINFMDFDEWLKSLIGLFDDASWLYEVVSIASSVFRRSLSQQS